MSYLEAMARGLPLLCREDSSLLGVLVDGENGRIYRTEEEFVTAAADMLESPALRQRMRENALERIQDFTEEKFVANTFRLYQSLVRKEQPSRSD